MKVFTHDGVLAQVAVRPEDEVGIGQVLSSKKGSEHELLAFPERDEICAPIGVVLAAAFGWYPGVWAGVVLWQNDGSGKGVAVHAHSHGDARLNLEPLLTIHLLGDIVRRADSVRVEAAGERCDGMNFVGNPVAVIKDKVDMKVGLKCAPCPPEREQRDGYCKFQDV